MTDVTKWLASGKDWNDWNEAIGVEVVFSMHKFTREFHEDMVTLHGFLEGTLSLLLGLVNVHFSYLWIVNCWMKQSHFIYSFVDCQKKLADVLQIMTLLISGLMLKTPFVWHMAITALVWRAKERKQLKLSWNPPSLLSWALEIKIYVVTV